MVLRSPSHPDRKGGKPESLSPEPLFSKTGTQGDTLPPSSGTVARLGASWVAGSGVLAGGAAAPGGPPCASSACYLASAPQGPGWDLPQVGGRVGEQRPRCVGEGSEGAARAASRTCCRPGRWRHRQSSLPGSGSDTRPHRSGLFCENHRLHLSGRSRSKPDVLPTAPGPATGPGLCPLSPRQAALVLAGSWKTLHKHHQL